jgi:hypothetical protein
LLRRLRRVGRYPACVIAGRDEDFHGATPSLTKLNHLLAVDLRAVACAQQDVIIVEMLGLTVSIVDFKRAKLLQDAKLSGVTVNDIARGLATMVGVKAVSDFDAGLTAGYLKKAEALLELAVEFARERRRNN